MEVVRLWFFFLFMLNATGLLSEDLLFPMVLLAVLFVFSCSDVTAPVTGVKTDTICITDSISLEKLFEYPLGPIPWSLATADGYLVKTNKSQLMHYLEAQSPEDSCSDLQTSTRTCVVDGNAVFPALAHLPASFGELCGLVFCVLPKAQIVHFVTDTYRDDSIKGLERQRRGSSPLYLTGGPKTKLPRDVKSFLLNSDNKRQLIRLLLSEWQTDRYACKLHGRQVFFVCEDNCLSAK
jgi:hypothetical protein